MQACDRLAVTCLGPGIEPRGFVAALALLQTAGRHWEAFEDEQAAMQSDGLASRASSLICATQHIIRLCMPLPPATIPLMMTHP